MKHNIYQRMISASVALLFAGSSVWADSDETKLKDLSPTAVTTDPGTVTDDSAVLRGFVNPRGLEGSVRFEYGLTERYGKTTELQTFSAGTDLKYFSAQITDLQKTARYHYRIIATTSKGKTYGEDVDFKAKTTGAKSDDPTEKPTVTTGGVADIKTGSAVLSGTANPHGGTTEAYFEVGTTTENRVRTKSRGIGSAAANVDVSHTIEDLLPGTLYHYRLVAGNTLGATEGADATFTTRFLPPTVITGNAMALSTASASVAGTVRANHAESSVFIDYGTNPAVLGESITATPSAVSGDTVTAVSAILPNLTQGKTYYYQLRAENTGGISRGDVKSFDVGVLSGLFQKFPALIAATDHQGSVQVNLSPAGIGGGWRFAGERLWRAGGQTATGLAAGDRVIEFRPTPGQIQAPDETVVVTSSAAPLILARAYTSSGATGSGGLTVNLKPDNLTGAQWRFFGETDGDWRNSGVTASPLVPGDYVLEFKPVAGRTTPSAVSANVSDGAPGTATITYFIADATVGRPPEVLAFDTLSTREDRPFGYVGQITSDAGVGSGFVVKQKVVATAGHVAFDDGTLASTTGLKWLFQRDPGVNEPAPLVPRGYYLMSGYAAQRAADNTPGSSSPASQNLDAAALYFLDDAGRSGFSGYLASDLPVNEFMVSSARKTLVGYPVDGIEAANQGRMHATPLIIIRFNSASGQTYTTSDIRSSGGNSGGPLCIEHENGKYYPAAIYLGGSAQTVVRALDGDVVRLFGLADGTADTAVGATGGSSASGGTTANETPLLGSIKVILEPAAARAAGAGWKIQAGADYLQSGSQIDNLAPQSYTVLLPTVSGFIPPTSQPVVVTGGEVSTITFTYEGITPPPVISSPLTLALTRGDALSYQIVASNSPTIYSLLGTLPQGTSFDQNSGLISGTTGESGNFPVTVGAINKGGADSKVVNLVINPQLADQTHTSGVNAAFSYQISTTEPGGGLTYTATGLPAGLSLAPATGLITGTPIFPGVFEVPISVSRNGASASAKLTITITGTLPVFIQQPIASTTVGIGFSTTLAVAASGIPEPTYQWYQGNRGDASNPVAGATSPTFTTPIIAGNVSYFARATNLSGSVDSDVSVIEAEVSTDPKLASLTVSEGTISPAFNPGITSYTLTLPYDVTTFSVTAAPQDPLADVFVDGQLQIFGMPSGQIDPLIFELFEIPIEVFDVQNQELRTRYTLFFEVLPPPGVFTEEATEVGTNSATLNGTIFPIVPVSVYFEYNTDSSPVGFNQSTERQFVSGMDPIQIQAALTGLTGEFIVRYRMVAETADEDIFFGDELFFFNSSTPPLAATGDAASVTQTGATLTGAYDAFGLSPTVYFEYGTTASLGSTTSFDEQSPTSGFTDYTAPITGLIDGTTYHYRMVVVTDGGTSRGETVQFVAGVDVPKVVTAPTVTTGAAVDITATSASLQGTVNPNNGITFAYFEYGPNDLYGLKTPSKVIGNGSDAANVIQEITGLTPGVDCHYRIVATNKIGTTVGDDASFNASFRPPTVRIERATAINSTTVSLQGTLLSIGAPADVFFDYGTDPLLASFASDLAAENTVTGEFGAPVSIDLTNLDRSKIYYYRIRGQITGGGTSVGEIQQLQIDSLLGLSQQFPRIIGQPGGSLTVNLLPTGVGGWRFEGESEWRASGETVSGMASSQRKIIFQPVAGYIQPADESTGIVSEEDPQPVLTYNYYESAASGSGALKVFLEPAALAGTETLVDDRIQWRIYEGIVETAEWQDSGAEITGLLPGSYLVECKDVSGLRTPIRANFVVSEGKTTTGTMVYSPASDSPPFTPPFHSFDVVSTSASLPYAYVGQIRSGTGLFSGFAVKPRVVATVAQAVFDDATLATTIGTQWLLQRASGEYEPKPQIPRGYYLFTSFEGKVGYAEQRESEGTPGELASASLNLNVAALYFAEDAGRGGFSGFLANDGEENPHLQSGEDKILVGYPVDGIESQSQGKTHAIQARASFSPALGRTYTSASFLAVGGMEGGPLCAKYQGGSYYPAGIYVGGISEGAVRAIDRDVINLFTRAEISSNGGDNNTGGGITHTSIVPFGTSTQPGALKVTIEPDFALENGGGWRILPETSPRMSGITRLGLAPGTYTLRFTSVPGFPDPADQTITIAGGKLSDITFTYAVETTDLDVWRSGNFATSSATGNAADDADPDNDGESNIREFVAGTNPKDINEVFKPTSTGSPGKPYIATVAGKADRTYILQRSSNMSGGSWRTVVAAGPLVSDAPVTLTDPAAPAGNSFYRVEVSYP